MNSHPSAPSRARSAALAVAVAGTFLIVALLVWYVRQQTQPPPLDQKRIAERTQALKDLRSAEILAQNTPAWVDKQKGVVRLPITNAMDLVLRQWQNPAAAKSNLVQRVAHATAAPPKEPEKPSEFE